MISTAGSATWVVDPQGCPIDGIPDCTKQRGQVFNSNDSTSYEFNDYFELVLETNLNYTGSGAFGFDTVGVGWQGDGGPVLEHQVVAGIATEDFWLGHFGLTPRPTNFSNFNDPQPSFMQTLKTKSMIPSLSWSYTAGAPYRMSIHVVEMLSICADALKVSIRSLEAWCLEVTMPQKLAVLI